MKFMEEDMDIKIWIILAKSESGDEHGPYVYSYQLSEKELTDLAKKLDYGDGNGSGYAGSYVHFVIKEDFLHIKQNKITIAKIYDDYIADGWK